jgi:hypothetical protein
VLPPARHIPHRCEKCGEFGNALGGPPIVEFSGRVWMCPTCGAWNERHDQGDEH